MSNGVIYYGAPVTSAQQTVSESLRLRGINLLKSTPRNATPDGIRLIVSPAYDIYIENLHVALESTITNMAIPVNDGSRFKMYTQKVNLEGFSNMRIVWDYADIQPAMDNVALDAMKGRYNAAEIEVHGKPAFMADINITQLAALNKTNVRKTTPLIGGTLNIASALALIKIQRLARGFLGLHQYPLSNDGIDEEAEWSKLFGSRGGPKMTVDVLENGMGTTGEEYYALDRPRQRHYVMHMNGQTSFSTYNPYFGSKASLPNNSGFLFPYVSELAKEDDTSFVPDIIDEYFFHALGESKEQASGVMEQIRSGWGNIRKTEHGDILAHIWSGIKLAITTGAGIKLMWGTKYDGFCLFGKGFCLYTQGNLQEPVSYDVLQAHFDDSLPQINALHKILDVLRMTPKELATAKATPPTTIHQLRILIARHGYNVNDEQTIRSLALHLYFPSQPYLALNAHNISKVLDAITASPANDHLFPMNPLYLLSQVRSHRLLSAFGDHGFTFMIPGGRVIPLTNTDFSYKESKKGKKTGDSVTVTKMHIQVVPIEQAMRDWDKVVASKDVHSPIGTPLARKASSLSLFREFSGNSGTEVLASLRRAVGVTVGTGGIASGGKRRATDQGAGGGSKKAKIDEAMDDI